MSIIKWYYVINKLIIKKTDFRIVVSHQLRVITTAAI